MHKCIPNLAGIQELSVAAYVKDLKARKLDAYAKLGCFLGNNSESKEYRIYWPRKRSVTVKCNVVFNQDNIHTSEESAIIYDKAWSEGEKAKIIQATPNNNEDVEKPENEDITDQYNKEKESVSHHSSQPPNTVIFPRINKPQEDSDAELQDSNKPSNQLYGCGKRTRPFKGTYRAMNEGTAAIMVLDNENIENLTIDIQDEAEGYLNCFDNLPPKVALVRYSGTDPKMLDKVLQGPNAKEWQDVLEYEINQLEKLQTWIVEDLPPGQTAILCSEVIKVKHGPTTDVKSYRVRIVARGHRQVEGVNYTEMFSVATKMPTICAVLANAAHQD